MVLKNVIVSGKKFVIKNCSGFSSVRGLMLDSMDNYDGALIHTPPGSRKLSIWMPFVKYDLDLIFLDEKFHVLEVKTAVPIKIHPKTWRTYSCSGAKYCLEVKKGVLGKKPLRKEKITFHL